MAEPAPADRVVKRLQIVIDGVMLHPDFAGTQIENDLRVASLATVEAGVALSIDELAHAGRKIAEARAFLKLAGQAIVNECGRRERLAAGQA